MIATTTEGMTIVEGDYSRERWYGGGQNQSIERRNSTNQSSERRYRETAHPATNVKLTARAKGEAKEL